MKNPLKNEPALSDMLLKLRFAEKKSTSSGSSFGAKQSDFQVRQPARLMVVRELIRCPQFRIGNIVKDFVMSGAWNTPELLRAGV